jgi:predicted RNA-binding Zn-ribbon protein involved in translation (DUF1610 family)
MKCFDCNHEMKVSDKGDKGTSYVCPKCEHFTIVMNANASLSFGGKK